MLEPFFPLATVSNAAMHTDDKCLLGSLLLFLFDIYPEVGLLDCVIILCLSI
jgi:hypothetical protein